MIEKILNKIWSVLTSKRFKAFYWSMATMAVAGFMDLITQELTAWDPENLLTIAVGLAFAQITKAINNYSMNKPL